MKLLPYPKYKKTGIAWLPYVPSHWTVSKVKFKIPFQVGWTPPTGVEANFVGENLWANISDLKSKFIEETKTHISDDAAAKASMEITPKGSLLYSFKLSVGTVAFAGRDLYTNEAIASFLPNENINISFLYYAAPEFIEKNASKNIYGASILNQELIRNATLIAPQYSEQTQIAAFLDRETAKIDHLIEKQQRLIELLEEKRQAVISHAVTKGMNPDASMKDSCVECLGEVPSSWKVSRFNYEIDYLEGPGILANDFHDDGVPLLRIQNVKSEIVNNYFKTYLDPVMVQSKWQHFRVQEGDLIISCSATTGLVSEVDAKTAGSIPYTGLIRLRPKNQNLTQYFIRLIVQSDMFFEQIKILQTGTTIQHFGPAHLQQMSIVVPPVHEQNQITEHVAELTARLHSLISKANKAIGLMDERRKALILAAITGKIDVREQVPQDVEEAVAS